MAYATLAELKARIEKTRPDDDATLTALLDAASIAINNLCNRPDGFEAAVASAREFVGSGKPYQTIDECATVTLVEVRDSITDTSYVTWTAADWNPASGDPRFPNYNRTPYTLLYVDINGDYSIFTAGDLNSDPYQWQSDYAYESPSHFYTRQMRVPTVRVTARWGYSITPPTPIREACVMQAARWYKRLQGSMADALASTEMGELQFIQVLDPDIKAILFMGRYVKPAVGLGIG